MKLLMPMNLKIECIETYAADDDDADDDRLDHEELYNNFDLVKVFFPHFFYSIVKENSCHIIF